jgi:DNA-binding Lrp family transcriptional regulator
MLRGDLATMPLADLLQWVDAARKSVVIEIARQHGLRAWMVCVDRHVVAASMPFTRGVLAGDGTPAAPGPGLRAVAIEGLLDLFFQVDGEMTLREGVTGPEPGVAVEVQLGFLVMEALRQLDEWPRLEAAYPDDGARLRATSDPGGSELSAVQAAIQRAAREGKTLGELRLVLGLSRHALLRRVDELRGIGLLEVEGAAIGERDLPSRLLEQAVALVRERQYAEAAHVMRSLLATTPDDARLRRLLEQTEREHVADCYQQIARQDVVRLGRSGSGGIASADQAIVDALAQKPRSVAGLVLVSPLRELETLVGLLRLLKKGLVEIERAG